MRQFWRSDPCYEKDHGVNGSVCSFIIYLSEVSLIRGSTLKISQRYVEAVRPRGIKRSLTEC